MPIVSHSNYVTLRDNRYFKVREGNYKVSRTVPDRTLSLRQLIERHNSGGQVKSFLPQYLGEASVIPVQFERMSLVERAQYAKDLPQFIADGRGRLITLRESIERASKQAEAEKKRSEYLALKQEFEAPPSE